MSWSLSKLKWRRLRSPLRRVLALDAGSRCLKLLLAESEFGRLNILKEELIDLREEGLVSPNEVKAHLQETIESRGNPAVALVLPQHLSISQVIDLPLAPESEVEKLIHGETVKLSGVSESRIVYDFVRTETTDKNRQQFWVTLCQEGDIRERMLGLGLEPEDLCEVTTTANALIAAYRTVRPLSPRAILVHVGAQTTAVVIVISGQGAFAASFQMGGDFFTRSLARILNGSEEAAEALKQSTDILNGPQSQREFAVVVDGWAAELKRQFKEWFEHNRGVASDTSSFEMIATGGAFDQPGLFEYLKTAAGLNFKPWPQGGQGNGARPAKGYEIAFGAALQALGYSAQPVSLLPEDARVAWQKRLGRERIELASLVLVVLCTLLLALGTWRQLSLISRKQALLSKVQASQEAVEANAVLTTELIGDYENLRPLFASQQNTLDILKTLTLLQQTRSNRSFWYVLLADQQSYFTAPAGLGSTNKPARTNFVLAGSPFTAFVTPLFATNGAQIKPGLIAELCVPTEADAARVLLSQLVKELKQERLFSKVDLLSDDLRRNVADSTVTIADRDFVLALDFAETDFQQASRLRRPATNSARAAPRRVNRPGPPLSDGGESPGQTVP